MGYVSYWVWAVGLCGLFELEGYGEGDEMTKSTHSDSADFFRVLKSVINYFRIIYLKIKARSIDTSLDTSLVVEGKNMKEFFIGYSYGQGGMWFILIAESRDEIRKKYPNIGIWDFIPEFATGSPSLINILRKNTYNISETPELVDGVLLEAEPQNKSDHYQKDI